MNIQQSTNETIPVWEYKIDDDGGVTITELRAKNFYIGERYGGAKLNSLDGELYRDVKIRGGLFNLSIHRKTYYFPTGDVKNLEKLRQIAISKAEELEKEAKRRREFADSLHIVDADI